MNVPSELVEAVEVMGSTKWQILPKLIPLALPVIMSGIRRGLL